MGYTNIGGQGLFFPQSTSSIPDRAVWPYVQQWHLDVQRDLFRNAVATLAYVGAKGTHLTLQHELNQLATVPASQNPYQPGQVITNDDCNSISIDPTTAQATATANVDASNPVTMTGSWANNLAVACGNNPDLYRTSFPGGRVPALTGRRSIERTSLPSAVSFDRPPPDA